MSGYLQELTNVQQHCVQCGNEISEHDKLSTIKKIDIGNNKGWRNKYFRLEYTCGVCNILPIMNKAPVRIVSITNKNYKS